MGAISGAVPALRSRSSTRCCGRVVSPRTRSRRRCSRRRSMRSRRSPDGSMRSNDAHVELSAVLSAPAAEDDGGAPSRSSISITHDHGAAAAAPAERVALCDGDPVRPVPSLDARRSRSDLSTARACLLERAAPAPFAPSTAPSAPGTALALGTARRRLRAAALAPSTARRRLRAAALALLDALSERPAVLFAALPSDERHHLLALLARRLEHSDVGMLRRPTLSGGD